MGTAYYRDISQWSQGEYTSASNTQDDLAIITNGNGFSYRIDDHVNASAGATSLTFVSSTSLVGDGIIERNTDVDFFTFTVTTPGTVDIEVLPAAIGANLDIAIQLFDSSLVQIGGDNPSATLSASIVQSLAAGTYYLSIDGVGFGNPGTDGYSDYASLGYFSISVTTSGAFAAGLPSADSLPALAAAQSGAPGKPGGIAASMAAQLGVVVPAITERDHVAPRRPLFERAESQPAMATGIRQSRYENNLADYVVWQPQLPIASSDELVVGNYSAANAEHGDAVDATFRNWSVDLVEWMP
jgi:hypothetical protein